MKRWHKFVLVLSVFFVLFSCFVVFPGASSYYEDVADVVYQPLFFPNTMTLYSSYDTICYDLNTSFCVDSSVGYKEFTPTVLLGNYSLDTRIYMQNSVPSSLYGYNFIDVGYIVEIPSAVTDTYSGVSFTFPDLYLSHSVLGVDFFDSISVYYGDEDSEFTSYYCSWVESYINNDGDFETFSRSAEFTTFTDLIYYYSDGDYPYGVALSNIKFDLSGGDFSEFSFRGYVSGGSPCTSIFDIPSPLHIWSDFFQPSDVVVNPRPLTILESVRVGLDAVWDTSLFGLFTIGQVFSACAGLALFTWLLKIFNR